MIKIVFVSNQMIRGGVEQALISLLKILDPKQFDITLLLVRKNGIWEKKIPNHVKICYMEELCNPLQYMKKMVREKHVIMALKKINIYRKILHSDSYWKENVLLTQFLPLLKEKYDIAVAYHAPGTLPVHYVINNVIATTKILFIHGDIEKTKSISKDYCDLYAKYNKIVCVSEEAKQVFLKYNENMRMKTRMIHNIIDSKEIIKLSKEKININMDICTVARLSKPKGIDIAIEASRILLNKGIDVKWYVCGDGEEKDNLEKLIKEYKLEDNFFLLGATDNPYKYIANCSIYVQPSRHEGYCLTLAEARILCKPIVTTLFSGASEQVENKETGTIVNVNPEEIANGIEELKQNIILREKYIENLKKEYMNNEKNNKEHIELYKLLKNDN